MESELRAPWEACADLNAAYERITVRVAALIGVPDFVKADRAKVAKIAIGKAIRVLLGGFQEAEIKSLELLPDHELVRAVERQGRTGAVLFYRAHLAAVLVQRLSRLNAEAPSSLFFVSQALRAEIARATATIPTTRLAVISSLRAEEVAYVLDCGGSWSVRGLSAKSPI